MNLQSVTAAMRKRSAILVAVAIGLVLGALAYMNARDPQAPAASPETAAPAAPEAGGGGNGTATGGGTPAPAPSPSKPLPDIVEEFSKSGYRFQFSGCRGTPGTLSMKKGTRFLLDNRDNKAHTFAVEGRSYRVAAYGYAVATAGKVGTHGITCDGGGAAEISVEP